MITPRPRPTPYPAAVLRIEESALGLKRIVLAPPPAKARP